MIIAVVKEMDVRGICGIVAILDNAVAFTFAVAFSVINQFVDFLDCVVVAVAVGSYDFRAVEPANILACFCGGAQFLHKGLLGVNAREILNCNHHCQKIVKNPLPWAKKAVPAQWLA